MKIHKAKVKGINWYLLCGLDMFEMVSYIIRTMQWKKVTCKNCLKLKGKK